MKENTIRDNILRTLLYYHVFAHPLTIDEIHAFYPEAGVSRFEIKRVLNAMVSRDDGIIGEQNGYYHVAPDGSAVRERLRKERISLERWKIARLITLILKQIPFVRGVMVTGSQSKDSSDMDSDIDFLIVTRANRLWIVRTIYRLCARSLFFLDERKYLCLNYFLTDDNLSINDRNIFTACELAHVKVMYDSGVFNRIMETNAWIGEYFPNLAATGGRYNFTRFRTGDRRGFFQPFFELFFPGRFGDRVDALLWRLLVKRVEKKGARYAARRRENSYMITEKTAKLHGEDVDHRVDTLRKYNDLLAKYGLLACEPPVRANVA